MCGIAGMFGDNKKRTSKALDMPNSLVHRGSDAFGSYEDDRAALYHNRLAILGIEDGQQPVFNEDKTIISVTNGEIYNYRDCAISLRKLGYVFSDSCDTNIIPYLYEAYGTEMFHKINGQFALAILDKKNDQLILARDRLGEKPLYYRKIDTNVYFSSEINPLLKINDKYELNAKCFKDISTTWGPVGEKTIYTDICSVDDGTYVIIKNNNVSAKKYYTLNFVNTRYDNKSHTELVNELDVLLNRSVKGRINADVPISFYLSGGLDSSLIAAIASQYLDARLNTFSISFSPSNATNNNLDESIYQQIISKKLNTKHLQLNITDTDMVNGFTSILSHVQTPILRLGVVPMYLLAKLVHDNGFKVAISGEGADELFGGYDIFKEAKIRAFCEKNPNSKFRAALYKKTNLYINDFKNNTPSALAVFFNQVKTDGIFASHKLRFGFGEYCLQFFSADMKAELVKYSVEDDLAADLPIDFYKHSNIAKAQYLEIKTFMSRYLLSSQGDRVSMAHSVECRYPFLDNDIVEFALQLNDRHKIKVLTEKYILKEVAKKYLPSDIINRPKFPYRAMINAKVLLADKKISWAISEHEIKKYNVFNFDAVRKFLSKVNFKDNITEKELMLLVFIISTQILLQK